MIVQNRYQLHEKLGAGGMGTVYHATDRLSGKSIALKQVLLPESSEGTPSSDSDDLRLSISREFRALASLRHPNIVTVMDYGFDEERQPYFTMDLLTHPQTLTDAAKTSDLAGKVRLLVDVLRALAYVHRRGIVHRDLKPANVLVDADGRVKVLDFGLATQKARMSATNVADVAAGTLAYMAPELFLDEPATIASDLYAVGVMAYEIFARRFPYNDKNIGLLLSEIMNRSPDFSMLQSDLAVVLERLLAKDPLNRYDDAESVITALCEVIAQPIPAESIEIRESFLQASAFVGREAELTQLREALKMALESSGSSWLIGGESGVGKSRLLDELRTRALVRGALVLRGQAVAEGGLPYQLWRVMG